MRWRRRDFAAACFDAREQVLLAFAEDVIRNVAASEANVEAAKQHFSPQEIVEIILTCGFYMTMARLTETTRVEIDAPGGTAVLESLQQDALIRRPRRRGCAPEHQRARQREIEDQPDADAGRRRQIGIVERRRREMQTGRQRCRN